MHASEYGPLAEVIAIAASLLAAFSLLLLRAVGRVAQWTWLIEETPPFLVTAGARAVAVALIAAAFILIDTTNFRWFIALAASFGVATFLLIGHFDRLRRTYTCKIPVLKEDGSQAIDKKGGPINKIVTIGSVGNMNPNAKEAYTKITGISLCKFMSGYGANEVNNPAAIWDQGLLAEIANKMTMTLMGILLSAVMALYLAASTIEVSQRPDAHPSVPTGPRIGNPG